MSNKDKYQGFGVKSNFANDSRTITFKSIKNTAKSTTKLSFNVSFNTGGKLSCSKVKAKANISMITAKTISVITLHRLSLKNKTCLSTAIK